MWITPCAVRAARRPFLARKKAPTRRWCGSSTDICKILRPLRAATLAWIWPTCPARARPEAWLVIAPALRDFKGKQGELALLHGHPDLAVPRVLAVGLGPREKVTTDIIRKAVAAAVQLCRKQGYTSMTAHYHH